MSAPLFSLVLATFGRAEAIGRLLDSLQEQVCQDFELIVADQNPDDRVVPFVVRAQAAGWSVQHLRLNHPNLSAARNLGMQHARGAWIAFPDDDCWYEPGTLAAVQDAVRAQPEGLDGLVINWVEQVHPVDPRDDNPLRLAAWRHFRGSDASSIALFLRADRVRALGGFDEQLGVGQWFGAGEETDLLMRLLAAGARLQRLPQARVHHAFGARAALGATATYRFGRGRARGWGAICAKNRLPVSAVLRGLFGPPLWPIVRPQGWTGVVLAAGVTVGRWQGYLRGLWCYRLRR